MNIYLFCILLILVFSYLLDLSAALLNLRAMSTELPAEFSDKYSEKDYARSQAFTREQTIFGLIRESVFLSATLIFLLVGGFNRVDLMVRSFDYGPVLTGLLYIGIIMLFDALLRLPFSCYRTFSLETRYGFNTSTVATFVADIFKSLFLAILLGGLFLAVVLFLFGHYGPSAWLPVWIIISLFLFIIQGIAPILILPLFNRFTPLPPGELYQAVSGYAQKQSFAIQGIYTMDGSRRSTRANAFFTGFGRFRRIVFFDTLLKQLSTQEIVAVLAHEMGHYKLKHIPLGMVLSILHTGMMLFLLSLFMGNQALFAAFSMQHLSVYGALIFFGFLYTPVSILLGILLQAISRRNEYQADRFAAASGGDALALISALKKLSTSNLTNLTPHALQVILSYGHPPILARIKALRQMEQKQNPGPLP